MDEALAYLDEKIDLYHAPFLGMGFDFEKSVLELRLQDYDDLNNVYVPLHLRLKHVRAFVSEYPQDVVFNPTGCYSLATERLEGGAVRFSFVFMLSHSPLWRVTVECMGLETEGGLSPEALAYKEGYFKTILTNEGQS